MLIVVVHLGRKLFHYGNHPIKWIRVVGLVVAVDTYGDKEKARNVYTLDDGSGLCVECVAVAPPEAEKKEAPTIPAYLNYGSVATGASKPEPAEQKKGEDVKGGGEKKELGVENPSVPWDAVDVGSVVKVKGRVGVHWTGVKQVYVVKIEIVGCTDGEVKQWDEAGAFKRDVLRKQWMVTPEMEEKCRKRRDRELRHKRKGKGKETEKDEDRKRRKEDDHEKGKWKRDEADAAKRTLEEESKKMEEDERKVRQEEKIKRRKERDERPDPKNKINYPSLAVKRAAAGKYDALGI